MDIYEEALKLHRENTGKISVTSKVPVNDSKDLSLAYSPGVAEPCREISRDKSLINVYTNRANTVAVVSNGTAVLGLGDIGPYAALPVMEGKAVLFKSFAGIDAFPICIDTKDVEKVIETVKFLEPTFGGFNLEDISAPACFEIERRLVNEIKAPVFHDDQHGTAIVTMAGLINALKVAGKKIEDVKIVISGAGSAGMAIVKLIISIGAKNIIMCDSKGAIYEGRAKGMNKYKEEIAKITNREMYDGELEDALMGANVFIGVSIAGTVNKSMIETMAKDPIIFAMANPIPEVMPEIAKKAGAKIIGTGRSDYPNQINNVAAFPGIFRGAIDTESVKINEEMKIAAAYAIAGLVSDSELSPDYIIPKAFDPRLAPTVAAAVAQAAMDSGVARKTVDVEDVKRRVEQLTGKTNKPN